MAPQTLMLKLMLSGEKKSSADVLKWTKKKTRRRPADVEGGHKIKRRSNSGKSNKLLQFSLTKYYTQSEVIQPVRQAGLSALGLWFKLGGTNKTAECQILSKWCNEKVTSQILSFNVTVRTLKHTLVELIVASLQSTKQSVRFRAAHLGSMFGVNTSELPVTAAKCYKWCGSLELGIAAVKRGFGTNLSMSRIQRSMGGQWPISDSSD